MKAANKWKCDLGIVEGIWLGRSIYESFNTCVKRSMLLGFRRTRRTGMRTSPSLRRTAATTVVAALVAEQRENWEGSGASEGGRECRLCGRQRSCPENGGRVTEAEQAPGGLLWRSGERASRPNRLPRWRSLISRGYGFDSTVIFLLMLGEKWYGRKHWIFDISHDG